MVPVKESIKYFQEKIFFSLQFFIHLFSFSGFLVYKVFVKLHMRNYLCRNFSENEFFNKKIYKLKNICS